MSNVTVIINVNRKLLDKLVDVKMKSAIDEAVTQYAEAFRLSLLQEYNLCIQRYNAKEAYRIATGKNYGQSRNWR